MGKKSNVHETHSSIKINGHTGKSQLRNRKSLKICHVNAKSLLTSGRLLDLEILCSTNDIDVLCVTETWLNPDRVKEGASLIHIPGYSPPFRCDRIGRRGEGVAIFVRHGVNASTIQLPPQLEAVGVQLQLQKKKMLNIVSVYRPPVENVINWNSLSTIWTQFSKTYCRPQTSHAWWVTSMQSQLNGGSIKSQTMLEMNSQNFRSTMHFRNW